MTTAVDLITYLNATPENNTPKKTNDVSDQFGKVFDAVSKNYNDNDTSSNSDNVKNATTAYQSQSKTHNNQKTKNNDDNQKIENRQDNNDDKTQIKPEQNKPQEKIDEKNSNDKNSNSQDENEKSKPELSLDEKDTTKKEEPVIQNNVVQDNIAEQISTQIANQLPSEVVAQASQPSVPNQDNTTNNGQESASVENTPSTNIQPQTSQVQTANLAQVSPVVTNIPADNVNQQTQVAQNQNKQADAKVQKSEENTQAATINTNVTQDDVQVISQEQATVQALGDYQATQNPNQIIQQTTDNLQVQPQQQENNQAADNTTQIPVQKVTNDLIQQATIQESALPKGQTIDLIKASTIKELAQTQTQEQTPAMQETPVSQTVIQDDSQTNEQMPVIATNLATANKSVVNQENTENKTNDITVKNPLTQELINKTNAKVVNVETSGSKSSNSDLMSKQSPQEQLVKLALNTDSTTEDKNTILSNITDTNIQQTLDKTISSVQNQAPRELSKTDILSQIHNQLDKFGQEEGTTKVTIVLKPENLGRIQLELVNSKEGMTAKMTTENAQVKELLDKNLDSLKDTIGGQGVNVSNVSVKLENTQNQNSEQFAYDEHQQKNNQQQSNNPQNKDEEESKFAKEMKAKINSDNEEEEISYKGEINYKV